MKLGKRLVEALHSADSRDFSLLVIDQRRASPANWLDNKKKVAAAFKRAAEENTGLPSLSFPEGTPVFLKTVENSRMTKTQYGEREVQVVEIIEPGYMEENPPGTKLTMWITQEVFRTKMEMFRTNNVIPAGLELCIVNLGKLKGKKFSYNDYYVDTAERGKTIIGDLA